MSVEPVICNLRIAEIPIINARNEFIRHRKMLLDPEFRSQIVRWRFKTPIYADYLVWGASPHMLLTLIALAESAGGAAPRPNLPNAQEVRNLQSLSGNAQLLKIHERKDELST